MIPGSLDRILRVDPGRLREDLVALAEIGATGDGGVHRPAFSPAHAAAREWFRARADADRLDVRIDGAGNHLAVLAQPGATRTLLLGSHLDSVPRGGAFDGALGVVAALEVLRTVRDAGLALPVHLEAIDFTDEEGAVSGMLGSRALSGAIDAAGLEAAARAGLHPEAVRSAARPPESLAGYLELHIEQGPRLTDADIPIGIVTGIAGIQWYELIFRGQANHAGTTPMRARADAGLGAAAFTLAARALVLDEFPDDVANVGRVRLDPGALNVVPGAAYVGLECRSIDAARLTALAAALLAQARLEAGSYGLSVEATRIHATPPTPLDERVQAVLTRAAGALALETLSLPSGAGHDAQWLARLCPTGMVFVPSAGGVSHSPREFTEWNDCVNGANVLLGAALEMATLPA